jgi:uncharacterized heparinase superfamily protein
VRLLRRARLTWDTVRYLRVEQIASRARLRAAAIRDRRHPARAARRYAVRAERMQWSLPDLRWTAATRFVASAASLDLAAAATRAADAEVGRFSFLNTTADLGRPVAWSSPGQSQLWRYKLQYGGYLIDIAALRPDAWSAVAGIMRDWIAANPVGGRGDAWHPFVVSERLVNWIVAILTCGPASGAIDQAIVDSLATQCAFVDANLETDVGGNHLLKNLKAMAIAGCFWQGDAANAWYERYSAAFIHELEAQLLSDGAHYERSPMYHLLVLQDALELAAMIRGVGRPLPAALAGAARAMVEYLPTVTHPDGEISLFNDSVFGDAPSPSAIRWFAARVLDDADIPSVLTVRQAAMASTLTGAPSAAGATRPGAIREDGGLVRMAGARGRAVVILDAGRACPDDLPAHAHADIFSFELSLDGARMIVDSGVGEYQAGPWREYYRSTRAHNTVGVDGLDQIECWGSFRVARRARIGERAAIDVPLARGIFASHDGYGRLASPVTAGRTFLEIADHGWLVIDRLEGRGSHRWCSYVHLAPGVEVRLTAGAAALALGSRRLALTWFGLDEARCVSGVSDPRQGWYAPEFGRHVPAPVIELAGRGRMPAQFGYLLVPDLDPAAVSVSGGADALLLAIGEDHYEVRASRSLVEVTQVHPQ